MEFMRKLFDHYQPDMVDGFGDPSTEKVDGAPQFLLALCLLDIGMRVSMASPPVIGTERKTETSGAGKKSTDTEGGHEEPEGDLLEESDEEDSGEGTGETGEEKAGLEFIEGNG